MRYVVGPDDWPLASSRKWWSVYDTHTGAAVNPAKTCGGWRHGSEAKAQRLADKLNRDEYPAAREI